MSLSILLVTGQSGSGKSTAVRALEDQGYFCIDNMPAPLAEQLITVLREEGAEDKLALVMDIRDRRFVSEAPRLVVRLRKGPHPLRVLYLDAHEEAIIRRYSETRRRHPLDHGCGLRLAISRERELLAPLRELADETLDTSSMSPHELRARIIEKVGGSDGGDSLRVAFLSFGFKYGLPLEADIVFDVRFLPNPYFEPSMRERSGLDEDVSRYVLASAEAQALLGHMMSLLSFLIPQYQREGKRYLTVAVGCTGGRHRSVAIARELAQRLLPLVPSDLRHRELEEKRP
jgi:RNase adapter protein RapZ